MQPLFEALENRALFSTTAITIDPVTDPEPSTVFVPSAAIKKVVGSYTGSVAVQGVHTQAITLVITSQTHTGRFTGTLTSTADSSIQVAVSGKVSATGRVYFTLTGSHSGGSIDGTGSGKLRKNGRIILAYMTFTQGSSQFPGTLYLSKV